MYLYLIFIVLSLLFILEVSNVRIREFPLFYKSAYIGILCIVFFLSMLRWENGTDWTPYYEYFSLVAIDPSLGYMEPGFTWLCHIDSKFLNYTLHLGIIAFLCIIPVGKRVWQYSPFPLFSLLIWFTVGFAHMFPVRQTIAISLFVFSWKFIQERKLIPFICIIAIAMSFHVTAIIAFPFYFLWNRYIPAKVYVLTISVFFVISIFAGQIFSNLLYGVGSAFFEAKLNEYMGNSEEAFGGAFSPMQVLIRGCINRSFYFFLPLFLLNARRRSEPVLNGFFNMSFYSFILFLISTPLSVALGRMASYTDMSQILLLPFIFTVRMSKKNALALSSIVLLYLCVRFRGVIFNYEDLYIPYHCVLFN